jgi:5-methylcytosine-specific restriction endonuclease McrA
VKSMSSDITYPTLLRMQRCRELVKELIEAGLADDSPSRETKLWWRISSPFYVPARASRELRNEYHERMARKRARHARYHRAIPDAVLRNILDSGPCIYCGRGSEVVDHIIPVSRAAGQSADVTSRQRANAATVSSPTDSLTSGCRRSMRSGHINVVEPASVASLRSLSRSTRNGCPMRHGSTPW